MIRVSETTDKTFTSNRDAMIRPLKAKVHKNDYYLDSLSNLLDKNHIMYDHVIVHDHMQGTCKHM